MDSKSLSALFSSSMSFGGDQKVHERKQHCCSLSPLEPTEEEIFGSEVHTVRLLLYLRRASRAQWDRAGWPWLDSNISVNERFERLRSQIARDTEWRFLGTQLSTPPYWGLFPTPQLGTIVGGGPSYQSKLETVKRASYKDESPIPLGDTSVQSRHIRNILKRFKVTLLVKS